MSSLRLVLVAVVSAQSFRSCQILTTNPAEHLQGVSHSFEEEYQIHLVEFIGGKDHRGLYDSTLTQSHYLFSFVHIPSFFFFLTQIWFSNQIRFVPLVVPDLIHIWSLAQIRVFTSNFSALYASTSGEPNLLCSSCKQTAPLGNTSIFFKHHVRLKLALISVSSLW